MKTYLTAVAAAAVALSVAAPAFADTRSSLPTPASAAEAAGLSLTEIAQPKFNRDTRGDDRHPIVAPVVVAPRRSPARGRRRPVAGAARA